MSELISGKEALIALVNGEMVEVREKDITRDWTCPQSMMLMHSMVGFGNSASNLAPSQSMELKSLRLWAKGGERFYYFSDEYTTGYASAERTGF